MKILTMLFTLILTLLLMHADLNQDGLQDDHVQPSLEKIQTFPRIAFSRRLVFLFPWTRISSMQEDNVPLSFDPGRDGVSRTIMLTLILTLRLLISI